MSELESSFDSIDSSDNELYEISPYPCNTPEKVGVTIKGSSEAYINAHKIVSNLLREKGDRYVINGVEFGILDAPKNKSIIVDVKSGKGLTGKANIKIYGVNKGGFATLMVTKPKGIGYEYTKVLAFKVIKFLLDGLIDESMKVNDIQEMKTKKNDEKKKTGRVKCELCEKQFVNMQGLKLHKTRLHVTETNTLLECKTSGKMFEDMEQLSSHNVSEHRIEMDKKEEEEKMEFDKDTDRKDIESILKDFESLSWEENRLDFIGKQNIDGDKMDVDEQSKQREKMQDEKIIRKQQKLEEEEKKYKEKKDKVEKEMKEEEKKRKRQTSIEKKKNKKKVRKDKISTEKNVKIRNIDRKYKDLFSDVGLNLEELCLYVTQGMELVVPILWHYFSTMRKSWVPMCVGM